jgi:hypothetical protein
MSWGGGIWRVWGRGEVCTGFWRGNLRERDHWGGPDIDGRIILRWIFRSMFSYGILYSHLQKVTIPDAVIIQFVLLKMGMLMLETCRGL